MVKVGLGIFQITHLTFEFLGPWEEERGGSKKERDSSQALIWVLVVCKLGWT